MAAAGWASWAVGAVTAKFYKSPAGAGSAGGSQEGTPEPRTETSKATGGRPLDSSKGTVSNRSQEEASVAIASVSIKEDTSGGDGWEDDDNGGGGWEDADGGDWGSLEEPMKPKQVDDNDWLGSFNTGVKSHPVSTMSFNTGVKSHSALSPVTADTTDSWGEDWGDSKSSSINSGDEARKRREEKKAERQKEIEAKRAAKRGPMKLGSKKNLD